MSSGLRSGYEVCVTLLSPLMWILQGSVPGMPPAVKGSDGINLQWQRPAGDGAIILILSVLE